MDASLRQWYDKQTDNVPDEVELRLYECWWFSSWSNGFLVVAAESAEQAKQLCVDELGLLGHSVKPQLIVRASKVVVDAPCVLAGR